MFKYGVSAALEQLPATQPVTLRGSIGDVCRQAKEAGYDAVELHIRDPKNYNVKEIKETAAGYGLPICAVANGMEYTVGGLSLVDDDPGKRQQALDRIKEHVDFCVGLDAMLIVGIMRGNVPRGGSPEEYLGRFSEAIRNICTYAKEKGVPVVLESIMRYINNYLNSVPETIDYIISLGLDNLTLHLDTHSMAVEEKNLAESIRYCLNKPLGYVHYSDNNRMYPGGGALDFKELTHALMDIDYQGYITVECLPSPTPEEAARRGLVYMKSIVAAAALERK